ncbi:unnamed protein product [Brassica napus]|uniref:(rape) hypothetical protein n=1 Tax=Brassica napus TaxID=3708 RepID=A0A817AJP7_BRANA|nr:unnamed protein product [Brassica napus]
MDQVTHIPLLGCVMDLLFQLFTSFKKSDSSKVCKEIVADPTIAGNLEAQKHFTQLQCIKLS